MKIIKNTQPQVGHRKNLKNTLNHNLDTGKISTIHTTTTLPMPPLCPLFVFPSILFYAPMPLVPSSYAPTFWPFFSFSMECSILPKVVPNHKMAFHSFYYKYCLVFPALLFPHQLTRNQEVLLSTGHSLIGKY